MKSLILSKIEIYKIQWPYDLIIQFFFNRNLLLFQLQKNSLPITEYGKT